MSKNQGYIKLYRCIQSNFLWDEKPFDKAHAFIDILLLANHADCEVVINGKPIVIKRGQLFTSRKKLADRWGWNVKTVDRFLGTLKGTLMVIPVGTPYGITLTVENYGVYQGGRDTQRDRGRDTRRDTRRDTNNKIKNIKNSVDTPLRVSTESEKTEKAVSQYADRNDAWDD